MALVRNNEFDAGFVSIGPLSVDTAFTTKRGHLGLSTDGATDKEDTFDLVAGQRVILSTGLTVRAFRLSSDEALLQHMPV